MANVRTSSKCPHVGIHDSWAKPQASRVRGSHYTPSFYTTLHHARIHPGHLQHARAPADPLQATPLTNCSTEARSGVRASGMPAVLSRRGARRCHESWRAATLDTPLSNRSYSGRPGIATW